MCKILDALAQGYDKGVGLAPSNWREVYRAAHAEITRLNGMVAQLQSKPAQIVYLQQPMNDLQDIQNSSSAIPDELFARMVAHASDLTGVPVEDILGPRRDKPIVEARDMIVIGLLSMEMPVSYIGTLVGKRHHSTVIHTRDKINSYKRMPDWRLRYGRMMERWKIDIDNSQGLTRGETA